MTTPNFTLHLADGRSVITQVADDGNGSLAIEGIDPVHFRRQDGYVGEPRIDHSRQIGFLESQGYGRLKTITLPHKKAALLRLERETFFDDYYP